LGEGIKFGLRVGAVGDAGVFVNVFVGGEKPEFVATQRSAESGDGVLAREGLLGIGLWIVERVAGVRPGRDSSGNAAVPVVRTAAGGKNDTARRSCASLNRTLRGAGYELLHGFGE
jgi:hypothetical protein